jgi:hypothetical protein
LRARIDLCALACIPRHAAGNAAALVEVLEIVPHHVAVPGCSRRVVADLYDLAVLAAETRVRFP